MEDDVLVRDSVLDVLERISQRLDAMTVGRDALITLHDSTELYLEVDSMSLLIIAKEALNVGPYGSSGSIQLDHDIEDVEGDRVAEPLEHAAVVAVPHWVGCRGRRGIRVDVLSEAEVAHRDEKKLPPFGVV